MLAPFLLAHIREARGAGFHDNVGASASLGSTFVRPSLQQWLAAAETLYRNIVTPERCSDLPPDVLSALTFDMNSSARHRQMVQRDAVQSYLAVLPSGCKDDVVHKEILERVLKTTSGLDEELSAAITEECEARWTSRKEHVCTARGFFGTLCDRYVSEHRGDGDKEHRFGRSFKRACNCGFEMRSMRDSLDVKYVNYTFYTEVCGDCSCCNDDSLMHQLPVAKSWASSGSCTAARPMISSEEPSMLPRFTSWALVKPGPTSVYHHNSGLDYLQHFGASEHGYSLKLRSLMFTLTARDDNERRILKNFALTRSRPLSETLQARFFLGFEYECPRGHRFLDTDPEDEQQTITPETFAAEPVPLYVRCPCTIVNPTLYAQLMRVHVVPPHAPVSITLAPSVRPAPGPACPNFSLLPASSPPITLRNNRYWVLRLPNVYFRDQRYGPDPDSLSFSTKDGCLLPGYLSISAIHD